VGWKLSSPIRDEVSDAPDLEDVVARPVGVAEVADTCTGAARLDGGFVCWVPHDHDVPNLVGSEVGVPEDQVAWSLLPGRIRMPFPAASQLRCAEASRGIRMPICAYAAWVKLEQSQTFGPVAPMR
jgi:hypothetical protein